jgi:hypothetical protein
MQRILLAAFMRGVGGGLALAATPYILAFGTMTLTAIGGGARAVGKLGEDVSDAARYLGELRAHRKQKAWREEGEAWRPEEEGYTVE